MTSDVKKCPYCAEDILAEAVKCKHCGSMLEGAQPQKVEISGVTPFADLSMPIKGKSKGRITFVGYLGIGVGILGVALALYSLPSAGEYGGQGILLVGLFSAGIAVASYLWARRVPK